MGTNSITLLLLLLSSSLFGQTVNFPTASPISPSGDNSELSYNNSGSFSTSNHVKSDGTNIYFSGGSTPTTSSGETTLYGASVGEYTLLAQKEHNMPHAYIETQPSNSRSEFIVTGNGSNGFLEIGTGWTVSGTATGVAFSQTNVPYTSSRLLRYTGTTSLNSLSGVKGSARNINMASSSTSGGGGFVALIRFAIPESNVSSSTAIIGLNTGTTMPVSTVTAANITNFIGIGYNFSDANYSLVYNNGSGSSNMTSLGSNFPTGTASQGFYEAIFYSYPGLVGYGYRITNLQTGNITQGTVSSSDVPSPGTSITPIVLLSNSSSSTAMSVDIGAIYVETF